mgnify:CR=1 FL=1
MSTSCHVHVYYKLSDADQGAARLPAFQVLAAGAPWCDRTLLTRRVDVREGLATWMESYENVWDLGALQQALDTAVQSSALAPRVARVRHVEVFEDVPVSLDFGEIE